MSAPEELWPFLHSVRRQGTLLQGHQVWNFQGPNFTGLALLVGMGGAAPSYLTAGAIAAYPADVCIVAGFGGALTDLPPPAGVFIARECWRLSPAGSKLLAVDFTPPAPPTTLASHLEAKGLPVCTGALVTTPEIIPKASLPGQVFRLSHPVLDLETAAVAPVAQAQHLPCLAIRAITDGAGEEIQRFLADIINHHQGVPLPRLLPALLADPRRVKYCWHLWRRSRLAGRNLALALNLSIDYLARRHP